MKLGRARRARIQQIARGRSDEALHVLEGAKAVQDALDAGDVAELWLRSDLDPALVADLRARADAHGATVGEASRQEFERTASVVTSPGVLALVRDTARPLPSVAAAEGLLLWLDGVQDPGNVGAVVRVAAAFGVGGLLVGAGSADPLGLKALRASAGLALRVAFARAPAADIAAALVAERREVWLLEAGGEDVRDVEDVPRTLVLVVGAEGSGPGPEARAAAARTVGIPLAPGVDSLNAAVAAGIAVAALLRRRPR